MIVKLRSIVLTFLLTIIQFSCKDHYNDTIDWMDKLDSTMTIADIKEMQPDFLEIDWNKPDTMDNDIVFDISKIKGNRDILNMQHSLVFRDSVFWDIMSHK